jgi:type VI secretion system secreted protein VgrG
MASESSTRLRATIASGDMLDVRSFEVQEGMSTLFSVNLTVVSDSADIDFEAVAGQDASFVIHGRGGKSRTFAGVASRMSQLEVEASGLSTYHLEIVPKLWLTTHRRNHRMFQRMSEPDMVKKLLGEWGVDFVDRLTETHKKRKYRVQYAETDFAFLSRMLEDAGISYHFEGDDGPMKMVLTDAPQKSEPRAVPLRFAESPGNADNDWVTGVRVGRSVRPGKYTMRDHDYRRPPSYNLRGTATGHDNAGVEAELEQFHYTPGAFLFEGDKDDASPVADDKGKYRTNEAKGNDLAQQRLHARRGEARPLSFDTNCIDVQAGTVMSMTDHPRSDLGEGKRFLVTESLLRGTSDGEWAHSCEARDAASPFRPPMETPKPVASGVESATVVGPAGEEIHTDEFGRVRVHFHWDRESQMDDNSSCWIHVSQPWGGSGYGGTNLPRIGQEVLVDFLGGDPDRPVITGRVYTNLQKTPYKLPANKTQSGMRSNSTGNTGGYNELMFEDAGGSELLRMQAEKDMHALVKNDKHESVLRDRTRYVKRNESITVGKNLTKHVVGNESETTGLNRTITVGNNRTTHIGHADATLAGTSFKLEIAPPGDGGGAHTGHHMKHDKITLSTPGGASITLEGDTITLSAKHIKVLADLDVAVAAKGGAVTIDGGPNVIINGPGFPSARMTDPVGGVILKGANTVLVGDGPFVTGLSPEIDALIAKSPTLSKNLRELTKNGWTIKYGTPGAGTFADRGKKEIVVDPNQKGNPNDVVQSLAHESGHAMYTPDAYVPPDGLTKDQYVNANTNSALKDEGEATMTNAQIRHEIQGNGGPDIGIAGAQSAQYEGVYEKYPNYSDRDQARQDIGNIFATGEHPSTDPSSTYYDYYSKGYKDYWDQTHP